MRRHQVFFLGFLSCLVVAPLPAAEPDRRGVELFESKIRPVLIQHCYSCHSEQAKKTKGGLRVDTRDGLRKGGETGPAVVPGEGKKSLLLDAIRHSRPDLQMPPQAKLPDGVIADFVKWIEMGAPDPRDGKPVAKRNLDEEGRTHWAFQPLAKVAPPAIRAASWPRSDIDRFLLARLEAKGLRPVGDAPAHVLARRLYLDLIGLPPAPEEVEVFARDYAVEPQAALEKLADQLLARTEYGERWARHWLDVARYADSSGFEGDPLKPHAWRYRDYVIDAFNQDKPFDRFLTEQLAGDEIEGTNAESKIALTFLRLGVHDGNAGDKELHRYDQFDDVLSTVSQAFLAQTLGCARCHDHKFEPFAQRDYYRFLAVFRPLMAAGENNGVPVGSDCELEEHKQRVAALKTEQEGLQRKLDESAAVILERLGKDPAAPKGEIDAEEVRTALRAEKRSGAQNKLLASLQKPIDEAIAKAGTAAEKSERQKLQQRLAEVAKTRPPEQTLAHIWLERPGPVSATRVLKRGDPKQPTEEVSLGLPEFLAKEPLPSPQSRGQSSGRRLWLAHWMTGPGQALTARVFVNRIWQHHFGRGLVGTPNDFGLSGDRPTHPELLDWLAADFIANGWKVKRLQRLMVLSRAYQLAALPNPEAGKIDPDNQLLWRWRTRRLEAEAFRDALLAISGKLDLQRGGPGQAATSHRRSIYLTVKRASPVAELEIMDAPDTNFSTGRRNVSTTPLQALTWMNGKFAQDHAELLAGRLQTEAGNDPASQARQAFQRVLSRPPRPEELQASVAYLEQRRPGTTAVQQLAAFCLVLFNTNEFAYVN